ncbi:MarP family serine protease [Actinocorallia aurea]
MLGDHLLDVILIVLIVLFAISGYRQGFIVGLLSFVGFVGGGVLGVLIAPPLVTWVVEGEAQQALLAIVIAFLAATFGQLIASSAGAVLRNRVTGDSARALDAAGGAVVSVLSLMLVAWFIGVVLLDQSPIRALSRQVHSSAVLRGVDQAMPLAADKWAESFDRFVGNTDFPKVFNGLGGEPLVDVGPPDKSVESSPALTKARRSIAKIVGTAPDCTTEPRQRRIEGTGFVFAPERLMTNAHVVAGTEGPLSIQVGSREYEGEVVLYDYSRDVAIIHVPGLRAKALKWDTEAERGDPAVVAGFPKNRPYTVRAAKISSRQNAKGPDIYRSGDVTREIYALRGTVEPGNSGGPLLTEDGAVFGVIFAAAMSDRDTGYALTAAEVMPDADAGRNATVPADTRQCAD